MTTTYSQPTLSAVVAAVLADPRPGAVLLSVAAVATASVAPPPPSQWPEFRGEHPLAWILRPLRKAHAIYPGPPRMAGILCLCRGRSRRRRLSGLRACVRPFATWFGAGLAVVSGE